MYLLSGGVTHPPGECYCNWGPTYVLFHSRACFVPGCSAVSPSSPNLVREVPLPCHGVPILALSQTLLCQCRCLYGHGLTPLYEMMYFKINPARGKQIIIYYFE